MRSNKSSNITSYLFNREINQNNHKKPDLSTLLDIEIKQLPLREIFDLREKERLKLFRIVEEGRFSMFGSNTNTVLGKLIELIKNKVMSLNEFVQLGSEQQTLVLKNSKLIGILLKNIKISFNQLVKLSPKDLNEVLDTVSKINPLKPLTNFEIIDIQNDIIKRTTPTTNVLK